MKLKEEVKRKQGLAALALVNFAEVYEIEGGRRLEVGAGLGWDLDVSGPEEDVPGEVDGWSGKGRCLARRCRMSSAGGRCKV
jgi:hypothetical protein